MTRQELFARVAASREAQGLPPKVTDPVALAKAARILMGMSNAGSIKETGAATNTTPIHQEGGRHGQG